MAGRPGPHHEPRPRHPARHADRERRGAGRGRARRRGRPRRPRSRHDRDALPLAELLARYDRPGPRYTSYPTAVEFHAGVTADVYAARLAQADARPTSRCRVYVHLPFCQERCALLRLQRRDHAAPRRRRPLPRLPRCARSTCWPRTCPRRRGVSQLHWGGGTPTYYAAEQLERVFARLAQHFTFTPRRRGRPRDRPARHLGRAARRRCAGSASTACRWACRTSRPRCRRPSTASRATSRPRRWSITPARWASARSTSTSSTACPTRPKTGFQHDARSGASACGPSAWRSTRSPSCRGWPRT